MNPCKAIVQYLESALAATADSTGDDLHTHIAEDRLPAEFDNAYPAVEVKIQAGSMSGAQKPGVRHQVVIQCFGGTSDYSDACNVSERIAGVLHNAIADATEGGIVFAQLATTSRYYDPTTGWPVVVDIYEIETI
jgi:hypothetical protein